MQQVRLLDSLKNCQLISYDSSQDGVKGDFYVVQRFFKPWCNFTMFSLNLKRFASLTEKRFMVGLWYKSGVRIRVGLSCRAGIGWCKVQM